MKRTTIFIEESLERDLQAIARQQSRPMASLVREALALYVSDREVSPSAHLSFVASGSSGRLDVAETHESILWREERTAGAANQATAPTDAAARRPARRGGARRPAAARKRR